MARSGLGVVPMAAGGMGPRAFTASCSFALVSFARASGVARASDRAAGCPWGVPWGRGARVEVRRVSHLPDVQNTLCNFYFYVTVIPFRNMYHMYHSHLHTYSPMAIPQRPVLPPFSLSPSSYLMTSSHHEEKFNTQREISPDI